MNIQWPVFVVFIIISSHINTIHTAKVLFLLPVASKSHKNVFDPLIDALASSRSHDVTVISPLKSSTVPNKVREIVPVPLSEVSSSVIADAFKMKQQGMFGFVSFANATQVGYVCSKMYEMEEVQGIMRNEKFDLIISATFPNQCSYALIWHFQCPHIIVTTLPARSDTVALVGHRNPSSFVPESLLPLTDRMTFLERVLNFVAPSLVSFGLNYMFCPKMQSVYRSYIPKAPDVREIEQNVSMILMNSHFSITYPRPLPPSIVEVGGMHCRPGNPLPQDLEKFVSGSTDGFIFFSLGSIVKPQNMPESTRKVFVNVFARLKPMRVLWKWDEEEKKMSDLPSNVMLGKWLPQQDILAHKKIRIFITHGGLLSSQEAAFHGVPLIALPFFSDQKLNSQQAENKGYCTVLDISNLSEERLDSAVRNILNNNSYSENVKVISKIFRDQPETPLQRAIYWVEYVMRHGGAKHLASASKDLNALQYHSVDVISFLFLIVVAVLYVLMVMIKVALRFCLGRKGSVRVEKDEKIKKS